MRTPQPNPKLQHPSMAAENKTTIGSQLKITGLVINPHSIDRAKSVEITNGKDITDKATIQNQRRQFFKDIVAPF